MRRAWWLLAMMVLACSAAEGQAEWGRVQLLKMGTTVDVWTGGEDGVRDYVRCQLLDVQAESLSCAELGQPGARVVFAQRIILSVGVWQEGHRSVTRAMLFGGLGFLMGAAVTDEKANLGLGAVGAVVGAGYGLATGRPHGKLVAVYRRVPPQASGAF